MNQTPCLGIDIAQKSFVAALCLEGARPLKASFFNGPAGFRNLETWLRQHLAIALRVGLESTNTYAEALAEFLHRQGHTVFLLNPARTAAFARSQGLRNKTDPADAVSIAQFVAQYRGRPWQPLSPQHKSLRDLTRVRQQLVEHGKQLKNQLATTGELAGVHLQRCVDAIEQELRAILRQITALLRSHPELQRAVDHLMSIQGIGLITAVIAIAELPPIHKDTDPRAICAWVGLTPRRYQSGNTEWTCLSRQGNAHLRQALFMPALVAKRFNPLLKAFAERLALRGKSHRAILGALSHKLLRLIVGLLRTDSDFDPSKN